MQGKHDGTEQSSTQENRRGNHPDNIQVPLAAEVMINARKMENVEENRDYQRQNDQIGPDADTSGQHIHAGQKVVMIEFPDEIPDIKGQEIGQYNQEDIPDQQAPFDGIILSIKHYRNSPIIQLSFCLYQESRQYLK
jgi:hypothetical protein